MRKLVLFAMMPLAVAAQDAIEKSRKSQAMVHAWLESKAVEVTRRADSELQSKGAWEPLRAKRLEEMRDMLGLLPWPERSPLNAKVTRTIDRPEFTVDLVAFESLPKVYVSANLYLPKKRSGKVPAIIYVCGHAQSPYGNKTQYQHHGITFAKHGYAALIVDSIQMAETYALHHGIHSQELYDWYSRGYTPAGVEVWNAMRAIDYLSTRSEIDASRIGMTGRSGGAAQSWFTAAVDPRVKVVVPVMGISTYEANLPPNTQKLHCDCMYPLNSWLHDMQHQPGLIAPRPLLMMHGIKDALFPVPGYRHVEKTMQALYASYGAGEQFRNIEVDTGHSDSEYLREQAVRWFDQHLVKIAARPIDLAVDKIPFEDLRVFGGNPPADARNPFVHEFFVAKAEFRPPASAAAWRKRRETVLEALRSRVFPGLSEIRPATQHRPRGERETWDRVVLVTEPGIQVDALYRAPRNAAGKLPALLYLASDGEDERAINDTLRGVNNNDRSVRAVLYPRGVGEVPWPKSVWKDMLRNAMHAGHTVDSMRLRDVVAAVRALRADRAIDPARVFVAGRGNGAALALYAAVLEQATPILFEPPSTHVEGPVILNVLRHTDLPEVAALLAPEPVFFYGRVPPAYDPARAVFKLLGKAENFAVTLNLEWLIEGKRDFRYYSGQ